MGSCRSQTIQPQTWPTRRLSLLSGSPLSCSSAGARMLCSISAMTALSSSTNSRAICCSNLGRRGQVCCDRSRSECGWPARASSSTRIASRLRSAAERSISASSVVREALTTSMASLRRSLAAPMDGNDLINILQLASNSARTSGNLVRDPGSAATGSPRPFRCIPQCSRFAPDCSLAAAPAARAVEACKLP